MSKVGGGGGGGGGQLGSAVENIGGRVREAGEEKTGGGRSKRVGSWRNRRTLRNNA